MNKTKSQSGFAHLMIITVILGLGLVGTLGYVFYQNSTKDKSSSNTSTNTETADEKEPAQEEVKTKTFTDSKYNITFNYPENWSLGDIQTVPSQDPYWNRSMDVKDENSEVISTLVIGVSGLGGICPEEIQQTFNVLDATISSVKSTSPVSMSFILNPQSSNGDYIARYGLINSHTSVGEFRGCSFFNLFESTLANSDGYKIGISFGSDVTESNDSKKFSSVDAAKQYLKSDKYLAIKKMILSLNY